MAQTFTLTATDAGAKLNKANARDVAKARAALGNMGSDGARMYAASLSAIHRSSSAQQQREVEAVIAADAMQHLFQRHPVNGCMIAGAR